MPEAMNANPTAIVIFGASGDLTRRKLIPALFNLYRRKRLPADMHIIGFARRNFTEDSFRADLESGLKEFAPEFYNDGDWKSFQTNIRYHTGNFDQVEDFETLGKLLSTIVGERGNCLYYLATPPEFYPIIVRNLGHLKMGQETQSWKRVVIEKPFGRDLQSARKLNEIVHAVFSEPQVFRIDHYLGKETAQNIIFFRFANTFLEPVWNRNYLDHVQITVSETVDVGHRAGYYDKAGVLRDMFQNHLLQLLALVAMEPPASFDADAIRNEKAKLFSAIRPITNEDIRQNSVRGQYQGYRDLSKVGQDSQTATFAAIRLFIDNWRWQGVPFFLRSGKAMTEKNSEVVLQFKRPPHVMFPMAADQWIKPNMLAICIQPHEGMHLRFEVKVPDSLSKTRSVHMMYHYEDDFGPSSLPDAYERLLLDAVTGDASLFTRSDEIEMAWRFIDPIIDAWESPNAQPPASYEPGSWGPPEADEFIGRIGRDWHNGCNH